MVDLLLRIIFLNVGVKSQKSGTAFGTKLNSDLLALVLL